MNLSIEFRGVRNFRAFLGDLLNILNLDKVKSLVGESKFKIYLKSQRIESLAYNESDIVGGGVTETWGLMGEKNGKIGEIQATLLTTYFFVLSDGWKLLNSKMVDELFQPNEEAKYNREAMKLIKLEKEKLLKRLQEKETDQDYRIDHNVALFLREWYVPIEPVKFEVIGELNPKFIKFLERLAEEYNNDYPISDLEPIVKNLRKVSIEIVDYKLPESVDWSKIE